MRHAVIVGASAAGLTAAEEMRRQGFDGDITLVGAESHLPYDRPPLSKQIMTGLWEPGRLEFRSRAACHDLGLRLRLGVAATGLDLRHRTVAIADEDLEFDALLIATGVRPRTMNGAHGLRGVHTMRTIDDALALKAGAERADRVLVVGAGVLGAEVAASLRKQQVPVTMVGQADGPMHRQVGPLASRALAQLHLDHGVDLRMNTAVADFAHTDGHVTGARLTDGTTVAARCVLIAVGSVPATEWLIGSGLTISDGIVCDTYCRAAPTVVAAGDVARWYDQRRGASLRLEHRTNATEQAVAAVNTLLGAGEPYRPLPYFWTDQYDTKIQAYGRLAGADDVHVVHGSVEDGTFVALYGTHGRVVGALGWKAPRQLIRVRELVAEGVAWEDAPVG